jgi:hypothetical protein
MNERLEKIFAAVVPGEAEVVGRVVGASDPVKFGKTIEGPRYYRLFLVNQGELDIRSVAVYSGGFATEDDNNVVELERLQKLYGPLAACSALLLQEMHFGLLDFVLWYYLKMTFADETQLTAKFDIPKAYGLRESNRRFVPELTAQAYVFELAGSNIA